MARAKVVYGSLSVTEPKFWAYAVDSNGKAVIVRCDTLEDAAEEKERLKHSESRTVGYTSRKVDELTMRQQVKARGWKMAVIR